MASTSDKENSSAFAGFFIGSPLCSTAHSQASGSAIVCGSAAASYAARPRASASARQSDTPFWRFKSCSPDMPIVPVNRAFGEFCSVDKQPGKIVPLGMLLLLELLDTGFVRWNYDKVL